MDLQEELGLIFKKVNTILEGGSGLSRLEQDLVKSYLIKAYEIVDTDRPEVRPTQKKVAIPEKDKDSIRAALAEEVLPQSSPVVEPRSESNGSEHGNNASALIDLVQVEESNPDHEALFSLENHAELSDQLANSPISDIQQAISINGRLLFIRELFNSDQAAFVEAIDVLNRKREFSDARHFLSRHLVDRYDWTHEDRLPYAKDFIKLIARRYTS